MIKKTKDYEMFKFRADNRAIIPSHVNKLKISIQNRNLLEYRPIEVNSDMEVIDGQHRLTAAKALGLEIYYVVRHDLIDGDIITYNAFAKSWGLEDFFKHFLIHKKPEYLKLQQFMIRENMSLRIALNLIAGRTKDAIQKFKNGLFVCNNEIIEGHLEICWETIRYIQKSLGYSNFVTTAKFWKALLVLTKHPFFDRDKWKHNLVYKVETFGPRATFEDYLKMLQLIYNWKNAQKISLRGGQDDENLS